MAHKKQLVEPGMIVVVEMENPQGAKAIKMLGPGEKISQKELSKGVFIRLNESRTFKIGPPGKHHTIRVAYKLGAVITEVAD